MARPAGLLSEMRPCGVARRSFGFTKLLSSRLAWPHFGQQRYAWILCEQALTRSTETHCVRLWCTHGYGQHIPACVQSAPCLLDRMVS